jgi:uncharacterized Fe-S cluster protein YjdI
MTDKPTRVYANLDARPWVNIDGAEPQQIVDQVRKCPSGALSIKPQSQEPA